MITVIPAMDIMEGKCVRLTKGDFDTKKIYDDNPLDMALRFEDAGMKWLHIVDLEGAKKGETVNWKTLTEISKKTKLKIQFGGGVKSDDVIERIFGIGISRVIIGSVAVKNKLLFETWLEKYEPKKIILGADSKDGMIAIDGWEKTTAVSLTAFLKDYHSLGLKYAICTDVAKDGMLQGPSLNLYRDLQAQFPELNIIASGGVSGIKDIQDLDEIGVYGVVVGKAIYEGKISMEDLSACSPFEGGKGDDKAIRQK